MSNEKPTPAERLASTKPGCTCAVHCQHVHGDQAADPLEHENDRLKAEVRELTAECERHLAGAAEIAKQRDAAIAEAAAAKRERSLDRAELEARRTAMVHEGSICRAYHSADAGLYEGCPLCLTNRAAIRARGGQ